MKSFALAIALLTQTLAAVPAATLNLPDIGGLASTQELAGTAESSQSDESGQFSPAVPVKGVPASSRPRLAPNELPLAALAREQGGWLAEQAGARNAAPVSSASAAEGGKLSVSVRSQSTVTSDVMTLGAVAAITGANAVTRERLAAIRLGPAPRLGRAERVSAEQIEAALAREGVNPASVHLYVPRGASATRASWIVRRDSMKKAVVDALQKALERDSGELILRDWNLPEEIVVPAGKTDIQIELSARGKGFGTRNFNLVIFVDGRERETARGSVVVDALTPVVKAAAPIASGEKIEARHLTLAHAPMTELRRATLTETRMAEGKIAARSILAGEILRHDQLRPETLVNRNDVVMMLVSAPGMNLKARGVAQENGAEGDMITVTNPTSGKQVMARVTGPKQVEVIY